MEATALTGGRCLEVGWTDIETDTLEIVGGGSYLCGVDSIPCETRAVHHIRPEDVAGLAPFDRWCFYEDAVRAGVSCFAAYNTDLESQFLLGSIPMVCAYKAALRHCPDAPSHSCFGVLYYLEDQGRALYDRQAAYPAHRARPDSYAAAIILVSMLGEGVTGADLMRWTREPRLLPTCPIGNQRGKRWADVEYSFLTWILSKGDMDADIRWNARQELDRRNGEYDND